MGLFRRLRGRRDASQSREVVVSILFHEDADAMFAVSSDDDWVEIDVVGESHRQDSLEHIAGPPSDRGKRHQVGATLRCEPTNAYDRNAIRVECMGQHVGFIPRETAAILAPAMTARCRGVLEATGFIVGGWDDGDSRGSYGIRVWVKKADLDRIGVDPATVRREDTQRNRREPERDSAPRNVSGFMDTGFSEAWDDGNDPSWYKELPEAHRPAIEMLRRLLADGGDPLNRHFLFAELEHRLYHCRELYETALDEFDATCRDHDAEMDMMRAAFTERWGKIPRIELYRQMAIRQSKLHDWNAVIWWTERGLAIYGNDAAREAAVEDLIKRKNHAHAKLNPPPEEQSSPRAPRVRDAPEIEDLLCHSCGATFQRIRVKGRKPHLCPNCRANSWLC